MDVTQARALAKECGFDIAMPLDVSELKFRQDVRDMCSPDMCPQGYGKSWSCPPEAPSIEDLREKAHSYSKGILVQTVGQLEDSFDFESIAETTRIHSQKVICIADKINEATDGEGLTLGAGACPRCASCSYPDEECLFPDEKIISMEASGLLVNQVCTENGVLYNHGENTIAFTSCCLFN